jgi:putative FmdB family regulatory protein
MPTYTYKCNNCDYEFDVFHIMSAPDKRKCPKCKKLKLKKLIGAGSGIIFKKGVGGFYCKDYAPKKKVEPPVNSKFKKGPAKTDKSKKESDGKK